MRVPADVVEVQVGAEHDVDRLARAARRREVGEEARARAVEQSSKPGTRCSPRQVSTRMRAPIPPRRPARGSRARSCRPRPGSAARASCGGAPAPRGWRPAAAPAAAASTSLSTNARDGDVADRPARCPRHLAHPRRARAPRGAPRAPEYARARAREPRQARGEPRLESATPMRVLVTGGDRLRRLAHASPRCARRATACAARAQPREARARVRAARPAPRRRRGRRRHRRVAVAKALDGCDARGARRRRGRARGEPRSARCSDTNLRAVELVVGGAHERGIALDRLRVEPRRAVDARRAADHRATRRSPPRSSAYARSKAESERYVRELPGRGRADPQRVPARRDRPRRSGALRGQPHRARRSCAI